MQPVQLQWRHIQGRSYDNLGLTEPCMYNKIYHSDTANFVLNIALTASYIPVLLLTHSMCCGQGGPPQ